MFMKEYGARIYEAGVILHSDGRPRIWDGKLVRLAVDGRRKHGRRAVVSGLSSGSVRRLEFIAANAVGRFRSLITLTYHARCVEWEPNHHRNNRIARRSKVDLNRFLSCLRSELGQYLWVQEFQTRGVIHYHVMCEGEPTHERATLVWVRATDELDDSSAWAHAVKVDAIRGEQQVRSYLGRYLGKGRQKNLPKGVEGAGRWWGRSRGLQLALQREVITHAPGELETRPVEVRMLRSFRKWLTRRFGFKVRGGMFKDWSGRYAPDAARVMDGLLAYYEQDSDRMAA